MKVGDVVQINKPVGETGPEYYEGRARLLKLERGWVTLELLDTRDPDIPSPLQIPADRVAYVLSSAVSEPKGASKREPGEIIEVDDPRDIALVQAMPVDSQARKDVPITTGVFDYFPAALAYVARVSKAGNDKHNPGQPLHWARGKSTDQADAIGRHLLERGGIDPDTGMRYSAQLAWRALALLQLELEEAGEAPLARGAINEGGEE